MLPLYFLSGVFIPETEIPEGVLKFADLFPIRHFFEAFFAAWDPATSGAGFEWGHLAVVAAWGALGLGLAIRFFRWTPREGEPILERLRDTRRWSMVDTEESSTDAELFAFAKLGRVVTFPSDDALLCIGDMEIRYEVHERDGRYELQRRERRDRKSVV